MPRLITQKTYHFRNLSDASSDFDAPEVILVGDNGQGKTNFLESIYVLCRAGSFRSHRIEEVCTVGESSTAVSGVFSSDDDLPLDISFSLHGKKKVLHMNQKVLKDRRALLQKVGCTAFVHEDIQYVNGAPEFRRRYIDQCLSIIDPLYLDHLRAYKKVFRNRNLVLKAQHTDLIDVLDEQLADYGVKIMRARGTFVEEIAPRMIRLFQNVAEILSPLSVRYRASWSKDDREQVVAHLRNMRSRELAFGSTVSGPHRDDLAITMMGQPFASVASTGQVRLMSLILKVIQAELTGEVLPGGSILLFDDVLLELDASYKQRFADIIPRYAQSFFTFLVGEHFQQFYTDKTKYYTVKEGSLHEGYTPGR